MRGIGIITSQRAQSSPAPRTPLFSFYFPIYCPSMSCSSTFDMPLESNYFYLHATASVASRPVQHLLPLCPIILGVKMAACRMWVLSARRGTKSVAECGITLEFACLLCYNLYIVHLPTLPSQHPVGSTLGHDPACAPA